GHRPRGPGLSAQDGRPAPSGSAPGLLDVALGRGDHHAEGGAAPDAVLDPGSATVHLGQPGHDPQPDTGAPGLVAARLEPFEHHFLQVVGNPRPLVLDGHADGPRAGLDVDPDRGPRRGVPDGVADEVLQYPAPA